MTPSDLLDAAHELTLGGVQPKPEAHLRRAVGTAYYAVFHCLARAAADAFIGGAQAAHPAWSLVYRAFDHRFAKNRCGNDEAMRRFGIGSELRGFATTFVYLQNRRHIADYKPRLDPGKAEERFDATEVFADIEQAREAIELMDRTAAPDRRAFAAYLLFPERR